ncbi:hypothetical protein F0L68_32035 [Solihabitans fulvus]|uniref:IrrE N-terminal-like domain-containing protein n=1 Tax=Solihabitans fulvus TaxID=1892852 RepID=A0A5B2WT60_9PSEU|nr:hypothetical protein [Solihabitans fulvus]KAA2253902.1 hypothetical protein F0L68_32035 [Solihabitans fulvus]
MDRRDKQLWQRCQRIVGDLPLPVPFDPKALVATLALRRGRPIELVPVTAQAYTPCGMLATTDRAEYILYPTNTTALHQQHILLHEVGHLLCGHAGTTTLDAPVSKILLPHLSPELVRRVLGRTVYDVEQEREAEVIASLISQRATREAPPAASAEAADGLARLGPLFETRARRRPRA